MPLYRKSMYLLLAILITAVGTTLYDHYRTQPDVVLSSERNYLAVAPPVTVYVTGAVASPGLVTLTASSRVADAVNACGGLLPTADAQKINLAEQLSDGIKINIPELPAQVHHGTNTAGQTLVNINTADERELDTLPGIGPATARKIIEFRQTEGKFAAPSDIKKVRGIGEAKYERLKDLITT